MKKQQRIQLCIALGFLLGFVIWTALVCCVDVQPIGPQGSPVGFASLNRHVHAFTGVYLPLYTATDWLGLVPLGTALSFAGLGLMQWIQRKQLEKVDKSLLVLGGFYAVVIGAYLLFEALAINYRPILINGQPEPSYPSSTTLLVLCVMPTALLQLRARIASKRIKGWLSFAIVAFVTFMVVGRFLSGVHWISDIIGGALLSAGLVMTYHAVSRSC